MNLKCAIVLCYKMKTLKKYTQLIFKYKELSRTLEDEILYPYGSIILGGLSEKSDLDLT